MLKLFTTCLAAGGVMPFRSEQASSADAGASSSSAGAAGPIAASQAEAAGRKVRRGDYAGGLKQQYRHAVHLCAVQPCAIMLLTETCYPLTLRPLQAEEGAGPGSTVLQCSHAVQFEVIYSKMALQYNPAVQS
jgi:hypothetical protein